MTYIVEHKIMGKKVRQWWGYAYLETLGMALQGYDVIRAWRLDGSKREAVPKGVLDAALKGPTRVV